MRANQAQFRIATMARVLGVSPSGFYAWRQRERSARERSDEALTARVRAIHAHSRGSYGAPRIQAELAEQGLAVSRKRVARVMRQAGLAGVSRRKGPRTTRRDAQARPAPDLVEREFHADAPDRLWVADITYVPTLAGFLYLAIVLDVFSRRVVGWAMAGHLRTELVLCPRHGRRTTPTGLRHPPFRPRLPVHLLRLRRALPAMGCGPVDGLGRGLLRQRHGRELLRHPRMRAARPHALPRPPPGAQSHLRVHRGMV